MFKANLIEDSNYYKLQGMQIRLLIVLAIPGAILGNFFELPLWLNLLGLSIYAAIIYLAWRYKNRMLEMSNRRTIVMDKNFMEISSKNKKLNQSISLKSIDKLFLLDTYRLPGEKMKDVSNELKGNHRENYLVIEQNGQKKRFDFTIDSFYMIKQLEKLIPFWQSDGIEIERISVH